MTSTETQNLFVPDPDTLDFRFDGHAGAGPSGAERWMSCTASLGAAREFLETLTPNQQAAFAGSSVAARQGTTAHAAAEAQANVVLGTITAEEAAATLMELTIMPENADEAYDPEMAEFITEYVDLVKQYRDAGRQVLIEASVGAVVPLTGGHEDEAYVVRGSADFIAHPTPQERELVVADLKYGSGVDVDVEHNPQIRIYALGALSAMADEEGNLPAIDLISYHIVQPRLGGIKTWSESVADLIAWRDNVLAPALTAALYGPSEGATFAPSETACQWCPVRGSCPALTEQRVTAAAELFDVMVDAEFTEGPGAFPETTTLSDEKLGALLAQVQGLTKIAADLKEEAQRRLHRGNTVPGFRLISYTPPRKWLEGAEGVLDPDQQGKKGLTPEQAKLLWKAKLLTPKQALVIADEAGLGKDADKILASLIEVPDKRPVIAPENGRGKTWDGQPPEQMFPDESGAEETA